ncbi:MAG: DNA cytosine methyltransferase [Acidithiobacillus sp.]
MRYLSLFSGIEAASVAWKPLGWKCVDVAEIEPFANAALAHHYPDTPNLGSVVDLRDRLLTGEDVAGLLSDPPDIVVGGSPCQSWSIAGSRKGLADPRGQLTLVYAEIIDAIRPEFVVWENVPGVLSAKDNGFGHLLGSLAGHGDAIPVPPGHKRWSNAGVVAGPERTLAWRILDAQHFGVPQRRRRVFLVGCAAASGRDPSEILFERQGVPGDFAPRAKSRKDVAPTLSARTHGGGGLGTDFDLDGRLIPSVSPCLTSNYGKQPDNSDTSKGPMLIPVSVSMRTRDGFAVAEVDETGIAPALRAGQGGSSRNFIVSPVAFAENPRSEVQAVAFGGSCTEVRTALTLSTKNQRNDFETETLVVHFVPTPIAFDCKAGGNTSFSIGDKPGSMRGEGHGGGHLAIAFDAKSSTPGVGSVCGTMRSCGHTEKSHANSGWHLAVAFQPGNLRRGAGSKPSEQSFPTLKADHGRGMSDQFPHVAHTLRAEGFDASEDGTGRGIPLVPVHRASWAVRRLTPVECARLQGFPDHYLNIAYRNKPAADGNKYKALGNSMAVPVMRWIGKRIAS